MGDTAIESKERGGSSIGSEVLVANFEPVYANKSTTVAETNYLKSTGLGCDSLRTYKRRKNAKVIEDEQVSEDSLSQITDKSIEQFMNIVANKDSSMLTNGSQKGSEGLTNAYDGCSVKHQRNIVLEQLCQSMKNEGGLKKCIQDALTFHQRSDSRSTVKESVHSCENGSCTLHTRFVRGGIQNAAKGSVDMRCGGSTNESNHCSIMDLCQHAFSDVIMSEIFSQLCVLLNENFEGMKADKLLDLSLINSRMAEGAYENSPILFCSDIQRMWSKLQKVGTEMTALAKRLSEKMTTSFCEQVGISACSISLDGRHELITQESDMHAKPEQTEAGAIYEVRSCRRCGEKADGGSGLVCDSCEEMYHVSCIEPAVKEIPRSWYCADCTAKEIESPHDSCVACERLNAARSSMDEDGEDELMHEEKQEELAESSNEIVDDELQLLKMGKRFPNCKTCRAEVRNDEEYRVCGHSFCPQKFYHVRCLTSKQLKSYGPCWYCPSCLCRACLADKDDDKIVLCDGCDHAYHIYCMQPPRTSIPKGKWFCRKCESELQRVRKARRQYENIQNKSKKRASDGKLKGEENFNKSGGVDMLLNAAKTLNYEENLAAMDLEKQV